MPGKRCRQLAAGVSTRKKELHCAFARTALRAPRGGIERVARAEYVQTHVEGGDGRLRAAPAEIGSGHLAAIDDVNRARPDHAEGRAAPDERCVFVNADPEKPWVFGDACDQPPHAPALR